MSNLESAMLERFRMTLDCHTADDGSTLVVCGRLVESRDEGDVSRRINRTVPLRGGKVYGWSFSDIAMELLGKEHDALRSAADVADPFVPDLGAAHG